MTAISPDDPALKPLPIRESPLQGKKALVVGIANKDSIAYGCARAFRAFGADLSITYLNEKTKQHTAQLALALDVEEALYLPCDVREPGQLEAVFDTIRRDWGRLDILLHSIAYAPREDLHGRVTDCSLAWLSRDDGHFGALADPHDSAGRAADDRWRRDLHDELFRRREGGAPLRHHGAGEGGAGDGAPLHGRRARREGSASTLSLRVRC